MSTVLDETKSQTTKYLLGGISVAVGLAWNDAVKKAINESLPLSKDSIRASFTYAIVLTAMLIFISMVLLKIGAKPPAKCVCADNDEVKKITTELNDKIDKVIYARGLESTGIV